MSRESYARVARGVLIAGVVAMLLYAFSPQTANRFGSVKEPAARKAMPDFTLPTMEGTNWALAENRGKVVFVNFWATWCPPCRAETPALVKVANRYRARGFEVVGVTMDDDPASVVPGFVSRYQVSYPILVPTAESVLASAIESLPTSLLVDKQGRVARTYIGAVDEADLQDDIEKLLIE